MSENEADPAAIGLTYPVRAVVRLTGLSPDVLRAWERRHGVVHPERTAGGTRRYRVADVERLRLVKAAVDAGHRIGRVADLPTSALKDLSAQREGATSSHFDGLFDAIERFDAQELQRLLSIQLSTLGATQFAREVAPIVLTEIGERWARGDIGVAQEHMASAVFRSLIGSTLQSTALSVAGPKIIFATPPDERHELGLIMATSTAIGAGAHCLYLGADLPIPELVDAARDFDAVVVVVSIVSLRGSDMRRSLGQLRSELDDRVQIWTGGPAAAELDSTDGIEYIPSFDVLEQRVTLLRFAESGAS